nr:MAG TPA: hypothetical protein [Caudoviricetes sp.]
MNNNIRCCPKCSSCFINYQFVQENAKTKTNNVTNEQQYQMLSEVQFLLYKLSVCAGKRKDKNK